MSNINGIDMPSLGGFVEAVKSDNEAAKVKFIARSKWVGGTKTEVMCNEFYSNGNVASREDRSFKLTIDEPPALGGSDSAPNPVEYLAAALCGCLTAAISTNSALFGNHLENIEVETSVDFNLLGILGMDRTVTNGATAIHYKVKIKGANKEASLKSKETIDKKSGIKNTLQLPLSITTEVEYED
jgi:uncharacterized OsmC-like protein